MQQGACVYLTVAITVKCDITSTFVSRMAIELLAHPCLNTHVVQGAVPLRTLYWDLKGRSELLDTIDT